MVGKQQLSPASGTLSLLGKVVPTTNFYRQLKQALELSFLYELVAPYYGKCGHQSIDPVLFFKLMLVEHLENLSSDRALIRHCQMRLDILFFWITPWTSPCLGTAPCPAPVNAYPTKSLMNAFNIALTNVLRQV